MSASKPKATESAPPLPTSTRYASGRSWARKCFHFAVHFGVTDTPSLARKTPVTHQQQSRPGNPPAPLAGCRRTPRQSLPALQRELRARAEVTGAGLEPGTASRGIPGLRGLPRCPSPAKCPLPPRSRPAPAAAEQRERSPAGAAVRTRRQGRKKAASGGPGAAWGSPGQSWRRLLFLVVLCRRRSLSATPCTLACRLPAPRGLSPSFPPAPPARAPARHRPAQPPPLPPARRTSWLEIPADAPAARRAARAGRGGEGVGERLPPTRPLATKSLSWGQALLLE